MKDYYFLDEKKDIIAFTGVLDNIDLSNLKEITFEQVQEILKEKNKKSLEELKSEKLDYLKSSRDKEDISPILFPQKNIYNLAKIHSKLSKGNFEVSEELEIVSTEDVLLDATESSKLKLKFSSEMLDEEEIEMWKCEDNVHRIFTKEELYHAFKLTAIRTRELFAKEHFLGLMVEQATTIEDLENIKW